MKIDEYGRIAISDGDLVELLYKGVELDLLQHDGDSGIERFNSLCAEYDDETIINRLSTIDESASDYHRERQTRWDIPDEYKDLDVISILAKRCNTEEELLRLEHELKLFSERGMLDLINVFHYLVETFRANNIVWGVGRGSSVASFVLYLLGIHSINPIKYQLDINEFLR